MEWNGFICEEFTFENKPAKVILPHVRREKPALLIKTEYFNAFPETEIALLERGYFLGFIENGNRWGTDDDLDRKARFIRFVQEKYALSDKCVPVGMSCGGLIAIKLAAKYPSLVSCLYLDAPVLNYMSCPCGFGIGNSLASTNEEILHALGMQSISELLSYREMPLDKLPKLVGAKIPVVLVAGDSDHTVPFCENGILLQNAYEKAGLPLEVYLKPGCDHHPHGLPDPSPVIAFIERYN